MTRLFIELYLDEDVSALLLKRLRSRGFIATSALEAGLLGSSDGTQLAYAVSQQRTLISHNRIHFEALAKEYFVDGRKHYGIAADDGKSDALHLRANGNELLNVLVPQILTYCSFSFFNISTALALPGSSLNDFS